MWWIFNKPFVWYRTLRAMWPRAKKYGLRYYWDKEFRRVMRQREDNRRQRAVRGSGFMSSRQKIKLRLATKRGWKCEWCKQSFHVKQLTLDHIKKVADGGTNSDSNLQLLCRFCHLMKDKERPNTERTGVGEKRWTF